MAVPKLTPNVIPRNQLSVDHVRNCLSYEPETGILRWKWRAEVAPYVNARTAGKEAGTSAAEYRTIGLYGHSYAAHRLAWVIVTGGWPNNMIDHVDGNKHNNRWNNIREADMSKNLMNRGVFRKTKSGIKGVNEKRPGQWRAQICGNKRRIHIGTYHSREEARDAWLAAARELHGEFFHP